MRYITTSDIRTKMPPDQILEALGNGFGTLEDRARVKDSWSRLQPYIRFDTNVAFEPTEYTRRVALLEFADAILPNWERFAVTVYPS